MGDDVVISKQSLIAYQDQIATDPLNSEKGVLKHNGDGKEANPFLDNGSHDIEARYTSERDGLYLSICPIVLHDVLNQTKKRISVASSSNKKIEL